MNWMQGIPWTISALSLLYAVMTYIRNGNRQKKEDWEHDAKKLDSMNESILKANMKLDQVCATTNETRTDIKSLNKDIAEIDRRVTIVERDVKTAFRTIDEIKEAINDDGK